MLLALALMSGCSDGPSRLNPVAWWHGMEGGAIAQDRPPPPNPNAPFPRIADQPARPAGMPDAEWQQLSAALAGQRAAAQAYAAQNPIAALPPGRGPHPTTHAGAPAIVTVPADGTPAPSPTAADAGGETAAAEIARLAAAPGPPGSQAALPRAAIATATAASGSKASAASGSSALTFAGATATPGAAGPRRVPIAPGGAAAQDGGEVGTNIRYFDPSNGLSIPGALGPVAQPDEATAPPVPASVPVPPRLPGFAIPAAPATYVAPAPAPAPAPYVPPTPPPAVAPVPIAFAPHSAVLTPPMQRALLDLTRASGGAHIAVTGFGDAAGRSVADQAAAMRLALERARAISVQLTALGVPPAAVTTSARAVGRGGLARLVE